MLFSHIQYFCCFSVPQDNTKVLKLGHLAFFHSFLSIQNPTFLRLSSSKIFHWSQHTTSLKQTCWQFGFFFLLFQKLSFVSLPTVTTQFRIVVPLSRDVHGMLACHILCYFSRLTPGVLAVLLYGEFFSMKMRDTVTEVATTNHLHLTGKLISVFLNHVWLLITLILGRGRLKQEHWYDLISRLG